MGFEISAAVALAGSVCARRHEPGPDSRLAVEETHGYSMVVTARVGLSNEIPPASLQHLSSAGTPVIHRDTLKVDFRSEGDKVVNLSRATPKRRLSYKFTFGALFSSSVVLK